jgi:hypothetical protein
MQGCRWYLKIRPRSINSIRQPQRRVLRQFHWNLEGPRRYAAVCKEHFDAKFSLPQPPGNQLQISTPIRRILNGPNFPPTSVS